MSTRAASHPSKHSSSTSSSARSATKRLLRELDAWRKEAPQEHGIERLGPAPDGPDDLLHWEAVVNGAGLGGGYARGRWLLRILLPATYPLAPPRITFVTPVVHANVALADGAVCLDLLAGAWTPAYSVLECVRAVRWLLTAPDVDSPLNVDVAALLRQGDRVGASRLVACRCEEEDGRYDGP